jgi:hypothetical protein
MLLQRTSKEEPPKDADERSWGPDITENASRNSRSFIRLASDTCLRPGLLDEIFRDPACPSSETDLAFNNSIVALQNTGTRALPGSLLCFILNRVPRILGLNSEHSEDIRSDFPRLLC